MSVCENKYAEADQLLESILTEKVTKRVKKAAKETCDCCPECKKKTVKENAEPQMVPLKKLKVGEYFKRKPDSKRVFVKGEWNQSGKCYNCYAADDINQGLNLKRDAQVFTDFEY